MASTVIGSTAPSFMHSAITRSLVPSHHRRTAAPSSSSPQLWLYGVTVRVNNSHHTFIPGPSKQASEQVTHPSSTAAPATAPTTAFADSFSSDFPPICPASTPPPPTPVMVLLLLAGTVFS